MKFAVFDNGKPAKFLDYEFASFEAALKYANSWLFGGGEQGIVLEPNVPWDYSGYGDLIEIRTVFCCEDPTPSIHEGKPYCQACDNDLDWEELRAIVEQRTCSLDFRCYRK